MATMSVVVDEAAALLNDPSKSEWDLQALRPFIKKAHRELQMKLELNSIPVTSKTSVIVTVPALANINVPGVILVSPTDLIEPEQLFERATGTTDQFVLMKEEQWESDTIPTIFLNSWFWDQEEIQLLGATQSRDVKIHYVRGIPVPTAENDPLGFINAELFLGPRSAAIAAAATGAPNLALSLNNDAQSLLIDVIRLNVKGQQNLPVRRIGYRRSRSTQGRIY